jgi:hypothetical protein
VAIICHFQLLERLCWQNSSVWYLRNVIW